MCLSFARTDGIRSGPLSFVGAAYAGKRFDRGTAARTDDVNCYSPAAGYEEIVEERDPKNDYG